VLYLLNLHLSIREDVSNALTTYLIPRGFSKEFVDIWLDPLVTKLRELHNRVTVYNRALRGDFTVKAHVILVTRDGPAIADVMGTKSPSKSKQSCRLCSFSGTLGRGGKYYYLNGENLELLLHTDMREQIEGLKHYRITSASQRHYTNVQRDIGVNCWSILMDLPTIYFPRSFPINTMHSMNYNIPKSMFHL
jgi:hypothetical protein